jgi:hypothetical protein
MNHLINRPKTNPCLCCHTPTLVNRRHFLKSLLPAAIALPFWQLASPALAEKHQAQAFVLSCIDFRFLALEFDFLAMQKLGNQYDWTALAGASLALAGFPHNADTVAFWDQLDLSYRLHHIKKVIILDHQDCGAYASKFDPELSSDPQREKQVHVDYLNRAYLSILNRYPDIDVELYFAKLNGEIIPILLSSMIHSSGISFKGNMSPTGEKPD